MKKLFKDAVDEWLEPAELLGTWPDGSKAYGSTSIYFTHIVRLEKGKSVRFVYDPGKVLRQLHIKTT